MPYVPTHPRMSTMGLVLFAQIDNMVFGLKLETFWDFIFRVLENRLQEWKARTEIEAVPGLLPSLLMAIGNFNFIFIMK